MEKKRRSRTRRDQPITNKPGQPYQKSNPHTRASSSTTQPASPDPSGGSPSRRKDTPRVSKAEGSSPHFDALSPITSLDEQKPLYSLTTSPARSSSPSSPYYFGAEISSPSLGSRNTSPLRASLPIPIPAFDHFQHMALTSQSGPNSISPTSPGYHELQSYSHGFPRELRLNHTISQPIPVDGSHLTAQYNDIYGPSRSSWNEYDRQQGRIEPLAYPRSLGSHPPDLLAPRLAHRSEQTSATSSFPSMSHGLGTPSAENPSGSYFYPDYEDHTGNTSAQNTYTFGDRSPGTDPSVPYYS